MLLDTVARMPSFDPTRHVLPRAHVVVPRHQPCNESGHRHAVITIPSQNLREAITIREVARQTLVQVPTHIDRRGFRYASTWWLQPRDDTQWEHAWTAQV